jgi:hypothetical protein
MDPSAAAGTLSHPWGPHELGEGRTVPLEIGPTQLWIRAEAGELRVARGAPVTIEAARRARRTLPPEPPEDLDWTRWATPGGERAVSLVPALPDRTVVLEPESPFRLLPRAEARVYVRVPLWIRIELSLGGEEGVVLLDEIPSLAMSDSWWGDFQAGELVYWLPTTARREMTPELHLPHLAVCPLRLVNGSRSALGVEKLALRVGHLSLFALEGRIWADESLVRYQGEAEGSQIEMSGAPPPEAPGAVPVRGPRAAAPKSFRARTFERLRQLPGMGGVL